MAELPLPLTAAAVMAQRSADCLSPCVKAAAAGSSPSVAPLIFSNASGSKQSDSLPSHMQERQITMECDRQLPSQEKRSCFTAAGRHST